MPTIDINLFIKAPTQYTGISFNSYANFNHNKLAVSSSGLYQICCGDTDEDANINAYFSPIKTDFGIKNPKKLRYVYIGFKSDKDMLLEVYTDDVLARTYVVKANITGQQRTRITIDSDIKGKYWSLKLKNSQGHDFAVDSIHVLPIILSEGFV